MQVELSADSSLPKDQVSETQEQLVTLECTHFYSRVKFTLESRNAKLQEITQDLVKLAIQNTMDRLFGEVGSATNVEVLHLDTKTNEFFAKCPANMYVKLHCSLTLPGVYQGQPCHFQVMKSAPTLLSLLTQSTHFDHSDD